MPTPEWNAGAGLIDALAAEPYRFEFFQAVRLLEQTMGPQQRLRFHNRLSLAFPPSQIDGLQVGAGADAASEGFHAGVPAASPGDVAGDVHITPAFLGLLGSTGALPLHYSERIAAHERSTGDGGPRAFLDMLSHRAQSMFYEAWAKQRPECMTAPDGGDAFLAMLTALAGAPASAIAPETLAFHAARIRSRTVSADALAGMLSEYFRVPIVIDQLVGAWQSLPPEHQAQLGVANCTLDDGMLLGDAIYCCDARARLRIGPLDKAAYDSFLPGEPAAAALAALLALHCGAGMTYEIHLALRAVDVPEFCLAGDVGGVRLGVDTWLPDGAEAKDRSDLSYLLQP